jgi:hypothetical protein
MRACYGNADHSVFGRNDILLSFVLAMGLALPFLPVPGDRATRMEVQFRGSGMAEPHAFSANTSLSNCSIMASALAYENPATGTFTRITCVE